MKYTLTDEQDEIIEAITKPERDLVVNSVAGSSKSSTIHMSIIKLLESNPKAKIRVLVFGKANAEEAKELLPSQVKASTAHSLAYQHTVKPLKLKLPIRAKFRVSDIPERLDMVSEYKVKAVELAELFVTSDFLSVSEFVEENELLYVEDEISECNKFLNYMSKGKINITHQFYLKLFHIKLMNDTIKLEDLDLLVNEEFQDYSKVMLDIATKYKAKQKVYIGDSKQSILQFTGAVNLIDEFDKDTINHLKLTKSFRVNSEDAEVVEYFMREELDKKFEFTGYDKSYPDKSTFAYLTRTNTALVDKMVELVKSETTFKLPSETKLNQLFTLPLALSTLRKGGKQFNPDLQYIQDVVDKTNIYNREDLFKHLKVVFKTNTPLIQAINLVLKHSSTVLFDTHKYAKAHIGGDSNLTLATAHIFKGASATEVTLAPDIDKAISKVLAKKPEERNADDLQELNLFYVAVTRHTHKLSGSKIFEKYRRELDGY